VKRRSIHPLLYLLIIPMLSLIYTWLNKSPVEVNMLYTDLDHDIPFIKAYVIPYMMWMPFLYFTLVYFYFKDRKLYFTALIAYTVSVLICYGIYIVFQTTVPRPVIADTDVLSMLVLFIYQNDAPFNCFPSIHCLSSYLLYTAARKSKAIGQWETASIGAIALIIIISTLFVKQHVVLDVFAGIILAHLIYSLVNHASSIIVSKRRKSITVRKQENEVFML